MFRFKNLDKSDPNDVTVVVFKCKILLNQRLQLMKLIC